MNSATKASVLFVTDDTMLREHLGRALSDEFEIMIAADIEAALAAVAKRRPDLIVADIVLPGSEGVEVVRLLRDQPSTASIPILMMSSLATSELRHGFELGADGYLGKPFDEAELRARVRGISKNVRLRTEAVRAQTLIESEQRAVTERAALLESITDAFYALDREWRVTYVNQRALSYFGLAKEDLLGKVFWDVFPQMKTTIAYEEAHRAVREKVGIFLEYLSPVSGRWLEVHGYSHDGGLAAHFRDISDRKRAENALRESERRLRLMSDALPALVSFIDKDYRYRFCNQRYEEWFGLASEQILGRTLQEVLGEAAFNTLKPSVDRALAGEAISVEARVPYGAGGVRDVHVDYVPERDETGAIGGYYALVQDITQRKVAEVRLQESEARLQLLNKLLEQRVEDVVAERKLFADLVEGTDALVQVADFDYRFLAINPASADEFERIYGVRPKVGDSMLELLADQPEHRADVQAVWSRALAGEAFSEIREFGDPAQRRTFYEMKFNALRDRSGRLIGAYQFTYDVTQRIRDQARLVEAQDALRQSQKMETLGQLTGGVAHDFNNLLTPIVGALDLLLRRYGDDPRAQRLTSSALQAADRAKTLIQRLLAFARRQHLEARAVNIRELLHGIRDLLTRTLGPQIELSIQVDPGLPAAEVDPNQLELALLNLAVNARDAMPDGGRLTVRASVETTGDLRRLRSGEYVRIAVQDTGLGMDEQTLARAIEPFFTTKGIGQGTGLGLSMVHGLAAQSGGDFTLESSPGQGTIAQLWLRVAAEELVQVGAVNEPSASTTAPLATVLVVDDEPLVRYSTAAMLMDGGYNVVEAACADDALQLVQGGLKIDALVTDYAMPGPTGAQLAEELRETRPRLPVLLITGFASLSEAEAGNLVRLAKPFRQTELLSSLAEVMSQTVD